MQHARLQKIMWALAVFFPLLNLVASWSTGALSLYASLGITAPQDIVELLSAIVNAFLLPAAPFAFIALLAGKTNLYNQPSFGRYALTFSALGALLGVGGTWLALWVAVWIIDDQGGGISYWGAICSMPVYVPLLMILGWGFGARQDDVDMQS